MRKLLLFSLTIVLLSACNRKNVKIPTSIISKDSMMNILMDLHIAEAGVKTMSADSIALNTKSFYEFTFKKYSVTETRFRESLFFYTEHPELLEEIYVKMTEEMSRKEAEIFKNP